VPVLPVSTCRCPLRCPAAGLATTALENAREFNLIGKVFGLAIYNSVILDVHFPMVCAPLGSGLSALRRRARPSSAVPVARHALS